MRIRGFSIVLSTLLFTGCDVPEDVRIQELPPLSQASVEARLGLPEVRGPWRFAGWELEEGDTIGLEAELPALGVLMLQEQKRDSLAGVYVAGDARAPVQGEVRRDSVVALVALLQAGDGRYLVGEIAGDTLWVESTTLVPPEAWRGDARVAFVRSQAAVTPFVRVRGLAMPTAAADTAALAAGVDSLAADSAVAAAPPATIPTSQGARPGAAQIQPPARPPATGAAAGAQPPRTGVEEAAAEPEEEPAAAEEVEREPQLQPAIERREPPRLLGVPVQRDTAGGGQLP